MSERFLTYRPTGKTKDEYPYSFDPYILYEDPTDKEVRTVYSDRMSQWDTRKYDIARTEASRKFPSQTSCFEWHEHLIKLYFGPETVIRRIEEHCNLSNGFVIYRYDLSQ